MWLFILDTMSWVVEHIRGNRLKLFSRVHLREREEPTGHNNQRTFRRREIARWFLRPGDCKLSHKAPR